jgi:hypothetical protein
MKKKTTQSDKLVPVFNPPLIKLLLQKEKTKGAPLTKEEVLEIRNNATMILIKATEAQKKAHTRGYEDIDPEKAWEQWKVLRKRL